MAYLRFVAVTIALALAAGAGYWLDQQNQEQISAVRADRMQTETISSLTGAIYLLDSGDVAGTRRVLLGLASGSLDAVIDNWGRTGKINQPYSESRCKALVRLRNLRTKHNFLGTPAEEVLRSDPEISAAETRRRAFLEAVRCKKHSG